MLRYVLVVAFIFPLLHAVSQINTYGSCVEEDFLVECADLSEYNCIKLSTTPNPNWAADFTRIDYFEDCGGEDVDHFSIENPVYIPFIAYDTMLEMSIKISNCIAPGTWAPNNMGEEGGQVAILSSCDDYSAVFQYNFCVGFQPYVPGDADLTRTLFGFEVGCQYLLLLDGFRGSGCDYEIEFLNFKELASFPPIECLDFKNQDCTLDVDCDSPPTFCESSDISFVLDSLANWGCVDYDFMLWDDDGIIEHIQEPNFTFSTNSLGPGVYNYTLHADHLCDTLDLAGSFIIEPDSQERIDSVFICVEDTSLYELPSNWSGISIDWHAELDTVLSYTYQDSCQCRYTEEIKLLVGQEVVSGVYDTLICNSFTPFMFEGTQVNAPVEMELFQTIENSIEGCDSSVYLNVIYGEINADFTIEECFIDSILVSVNIEGIPTDISASTIVWLDDMANELGTGPSITLGLSQAYSVVLRMEYGTRTCDHVLASEFQWAAPEDGNLSIPDYECYTSNDTIIINFAFTEDENPALQIEQISNYVFTDQGGSWLFTEMTEDDEVSIQLFSVIEGVCISDTLQIDCSLDCVPYDITLVEYEEPICWSPDQGPIILEHITTPLIGTDADVNWYEGDNLISNNFMPEASSDTSYTILFTIFENGCYKEASMDLEVIIEAELILVEEPKTLCQGDEIDILPLINTNIPTSQYDLSGELDNILAISDQEIVLSWDTPGTKEISLVSFNTVDCPSNEVSITIEVEERIDFSIACDQIEDDVLFQWPAIPCMENYEVFVNGTSIGMVTDTFYILENIPSETTINFEVLPLGDCACPYEALETECTTDDCPTIDLIGSINDTAYCINALPASLQLQAFDQLGNVMNDVGSWEGQGIDDMGFIEIDQLPVGVHTYEFNYAFDATCEYVLIINIEILAIPSHEYALIQPSCYLEETGLLLLGELPTTMQASLELDGSMISWASEIPLSIGQHEIVLYDQNGCNQIFSIEIFEVNEPDIIVVGDNTILVGDNNLFSVTSDVSIDSISWYLNDELLCSGVACQELNITDFEGDIMELCALCFFSDGCFKEVCIDLYAEVFTEVYIPNIFSPTTSGINGTWSIGTNDQELILDEVHIYDRWGNRMLFRENVMILGQTEIWDGTCNGVQAISGVYVYVIEYRDQNGSIVREAGDLTLLR